MNNVNLELERIKLNRFKCIRNSAYVGSAIKRTLVKIKNNYSRHGFFSTFVTVFKIYPSLVIEKISLKIKRNIKKIFILIKTKETRLKNECDACFIYSVYITGGLGDALMVARMVRDFQNEISENASFDVFYTSPKNVVFFFENIKGFRGCIDSSCYDFVFKSYDLSIKANQYVTFHMESINYNKLVLRYPEVIKIIGANLKLRKNVEHYITNHPFLDGAFADSAVKKRMKRFSFLHHMLGIDYGGDVINLAIDESFIKKIELHSCNYITIHDGWDNTFNLLNERPTKAMPSGFWGEVVKNIKKHCNDVKIVQIGGAKGHDIPMVDINLRNAISFRESAAILSRSLLHIDVESGLVHLATAMNVKCIVLFGPTNVDWFGYDRNFNIPPKECGNCWWATDSWMDFCPLGKKKPACTTSHSPKEVVETSLEYLHSLDLQEQKTVRNFTYNNQ